MSSSDGVTGEAAKALRAYAWDHFDFWQSTDPRRISTETALEVASMLDEAPATPCGATEALAREVIARLG